MKLRLWVCAIGVCLFASRVLLPAAFAQSPDSNELFARKNLVAWCIVPFDSKKRGPEERAAMLEKLGFSRFAYDYRAEHIPTFDAEIEALKKHHVELTAWWFPTVLNNEAKSTLAIFKKHNVTPQLWVTGGGEPTKSEQEQQKRVADEAARIRPIAVAAGEVGCKVALYNHGGWFGEPENQIAVIQAINLPNVGIVYNMHHGHDHLDRFPELLQKMKPYLLALNLNGMVKNGDRQGQKILQLGQGDLELSLLKTIQSSGYKGLIGILGHTQDDAEERLHDNLDGLDWLLPQLAGKPAGPKPKPRTPVPVAQTTAAAPKENRPNLTEGKFGKAIDGRAGGAFVAGADEFREFPITVECWAKLTETAPYNILVSNDLKLSGTHWELFSMAGSGKLTAYAPGFAPDHCHSEAMICDGKWHQVAMILEPERIRLLVDGKVVADQPHKRTEMTSVPGAFAIGSLVDHQIGCPGLIDEVRISKGVRSFASISEKAFVLDDSTIALWHLDEVVQQNQLDDATRNHPAILGQTSSSSTADISARNKIEGHWGEDALGFRWTEQDSRDDRFGQMDTGPFLSASITGPGGNVFKGIVVRLGDKRTASICYDTELMRASAGWTGYVKFDPARFGIIVPPRIDGPVTFTTPQFGGWTRTDDFSKFRETSRYGGLPKTEAHYEGLYRHGQRVVMEWKIGSGGAGEGYQGKPTTILESPWLEEADNVAALTRTLWVGPSNTPLAMIVAEENSHVRLRDGGSNATFMRGPGNTHVIKIPPRSKPVSLKLFIAAGPVDYRELDKLVAASTPPEDLTTLIKPSTPIWGEPLVTIGEVSEIRSPYVIDTITLPFDNPFKALMFCGGHDFLPDGRAVMCTLHGDVWIVDGIDQSLKKITWRRFATGLFQPLGIKVKPSASGQKNVGGMDVYVVGRDQITRLHDLNGDGEADRYENFNNDAYVSLAGHEYVTCLETDRAGNFYYIKGNCNSEIPHDGCLLRVTPDGSKLEVFATGFRNSDGIAIGPNDEITVAPQEGEWTPASSVFDVHQGRFYGMTSSHHQPTKPTDFYRPFAWFPRLADNSSGGQTWVPKGDLGPLSGQMLLLSFGQCELRVMMREPLPVDDQSTNPTVASWGQRRSPLVTMNGGSTELPLTFASGIHRAKFHPHDHALYLTGLKGWVTSAVNDGCFQRVRYTGQPVDLLLGMKTYHNGIALTFSRELNRDDVVNVDNYQIEAWNYHWSSTYGSPDLRPSAPGQLGRDPVEPVSVTLLPDNKTLFIEIPDLKPVDQMGISYSLRSADGTAIENTAYLTLNGVPNEAMPEDRLYRSKADAERAELLARLSPGVLLKTPSVADPTSIRLMAWPALKLDGFAREVVAEGYLKVPATAEYRFSVESERDAELELNDERWLLGKQPTAIKLRKGLISIRVHQSKDSQNSPFRLMWESNQFPRETIPASMLLHEAPTDERSLRRHQQELGRSLFDQHQCANCHQTATASNAAPNSAARVETLRQSPSLTAIGSRLTSEWLTEWLTNPSHVRSNATMPQFFGENDRQKIADVVAYLGNLREPGDSSATSQVKEEDAALTTRGGWLFERLGCIACHTFEQTDVNPEWNRVSLHFVAKKFQSGRLEQFLSAPHRHHVGSLMPNFHLNTEDVPAIAAWIRKNSRGELSDQPTAIMGNPERGMAVFNEMKCNRCHQTSEGGARVTADVKAAWGYDAVEGCLAETAQSKNPHYRFSPEQTKAFAAYLRTSGIEKPGLNLTATSATHVIKVLRCNACHARDASSASWPEIAAEEGSGQLTDVVPQLTWIGDKLQGNWVEQFIKGDIPHKPRPWIAARMPSFPVYARLISESFANEHGKPFNEPIPEKLSSEAIEIGRRLTLRDGGLDCRQCHGVGNDRPGGDVGTQIALGINFAMVPDRLRPDFVMQQLLDPPRYDVGSRMPRFAPDLKTTAIKQIEGGNAKKQFEALRQYLWSLKADQKPGT